MKVKIMMFFICGLITNFTYAYEFSENVKKATIFTIQKMMTNELEHGNPQQFFLLDPSKAFYITANDLYDLYKNNAFKASQILKEHHYKIISGNVDSIESYDQGTKILLNTMSGQEIRSPITLFVSQKFNDKAYNLNKGDHIELLCFAEKNYYAPINSISLTGCTEIKDFIHDYADLYTRSFFKYIEKDEKLTLGEVDIRSLYIAIMIKNIADKYDDFRGYSDDKIKESIKNFQLDFDDYMEFKNRLASNSQKVTVN
jgi:hypothetical protein